MLANELLRKLENKSITKTELLHEVGQDFNLIPQLLQGVSSQKAFVRYGCAAVLIDLTEKYPEKMYQHMDFFIELMNSKHRILVWNALAAIASLARVDKQKKFDAVFDRYFSFLDDEYMITVANVVGNSGKIALAKPYFIPKITKELLKVENLSTTPHLTEECRRVIAEKTVKTFDQFYDKIQDKDKDKVVSFIRKHINSPRKTLKNEARNFLAKWTT